MRADNSMLGNTSKSTEPRIEQVFVRNTRGSPFKAFDTELYRLRGLVEVDLAQDAQLEQLGETYICSLSSQTVTYKGQLTPEQVREAQWWGRVGGLEARWGRASSRGVKM